MTYTQAVTIRTLQLQGVDIGDKLLNEAIAVIKNTRTPTAWPELGKRDQAAEAAEKLDTALRFLRNGIAPTGDEGVEYMLALQTLRRAAGVSAA